MNAPRIYIYIYLPTNLAYSSSVGLHLPYSSMASILSNERRCKNWWASFQITSRTVRISKFVRLEPIFLRNTFSIKLTPHVYSSRDQEQGEKCLGRSGSYIISTLKILEINNI